MIALGAVDLSNYVVAAAAAKPCLVRVREDQAHHLMQPNRGWRPSQILRLESHVKKML